MYKYKHMPKLVLAGSFNQDHDWTQPTIVDGRDALRKSASSAVVDEWGDIEPKKNASLIHLIAMGAHEVTGCNRNNDSWRGDFLKEAHPTFKKHGALYRNHKSKDFNKREGEVEKTAYNDDMGRVELLVSADHDKCGDWLSDIEKGKRVDFSMGFDCFHPSTLVKTVDGDKRIDNIEVGDMVLTHTGSFMPVEAVLPSQRGDRKVLRIKMQTRGEPLLVTEDHKILVVKRDQVRRPKRDRWPNFLERMKPEWIKASDLADGDYMLRPVLQALDVAEMDTGIAYLLGQYLGDGNVSEFTDNSVAITTNVADTHLLRRMVDICLRLEWDFSIDYLNYDRELYRKKEATSMRIREPEFAQLCKRYCGRTGDKYVRQEVWNWSQEALLFFLGGYVDADGCYDPEKKYIRTCSVLDKLSETVQQMFFTAGIVATSWKDWFSLRPGYKTSRAYSSKHDYANITFVNKSDAWRLHGYSMKVEPGESVRAQECILFDHAGVQYLACPVNSISESKDQPGQVFCLTVQDDHSFVAEGAIVHNCHHDVCSICSNEAPTRKDYCEHVKKNAAAPYGIGKILPDGRKCFVFNPEGVFNDISKVGTGADMIAQHLRKVANFDDDETIGGAELMETLFPEVASEKLAAKIAIAEKLSSMEKIIPMSGTRYGKDKKSIKSETAEKLRSMPADKMFGELAKAGCLLPARDFFSLVMGDRIHGMESIVDEVEKVAHLAFSHASSSDTILESVCSNGNFECAKIAFSALNTDEQESLVFDFGLDEELVSERLLKMAMVGDRRISPCSLSQVSLPALKMLEEYAAYKLAAVEAGLIDPDMIRLAACIN